MNAVAEFLIAVLTDFKTEGPVARIGFVALVVGAVFGVALWFVRQQACGPARQADPDHRPRAALAR